MKVSILGVGALGSAIGDRLVTCGHELTAYNRTQSKLSDLVTKGAVATDCPATAIRASAVSLLVLRDGPTTVEVLTEAVMQQGLELEGKTLVQMGTLAPTESESLLAWVEARGGVYVEAPVLGSRPQAHAGTLQILLGTSAEHNGTDWARVLADLGDPTLIGAIPSASWLKLGLNQIIASHITSFSLSLGMIRRAGVPTEQFMEILRASGIYAKSFDGKLDRLESRTFEKPNFPAELMLKDIELVETAATSLGLNTTTLPAFKALFERALELGWASSDYSAVYQAIDPDDS